MKSSVIFLVAVPIALLLNCCNKEDEPVLIASDYITYFDENPLDDQIIGVISAGVSRGSIDYSIISTTPSGAFTIDANGTLKVEDPLLFDFETNPVIAGIAKLECEGIVKEINISIYLNDVDIKRAGLWEVTGPTNNISFVGNCWLGQKRNLPHGGTLKSINQIGRSTGAHVQMALYEDNNGIPGDLLAVSEAGVVNVNGEIALTVSPIKIPDGDYWIMSIYDITGYHSYILGLTYGAPTCFKYLTYGSAIPSNASDFDVSFDYGYTYSITVE